MRLHPTRPVRFAVATLLVSSLGFALVGAQDSDETFIDQRQRLMSAFGASMGSVGDVLKYKLDHGPEQIEIHAGNVSDYAKLIRRVFEKEVTAGATDAKPEIWNNWEDFVSKAKTLETEAGKLATAAAGGDMSAIMPLVKATGDACGGCHDVYRKPKEESYKNE